MIELTFTPNSAASNGIAVAYCDGLAALVSQ